MKGLRQAVAFLTPVGGAAVPTPAALLWFPAIGAALGFAVGGVWWVSARIWPAAVAAAVAVIADLALTGLLHVDGLCDAADGLLPPIARDRRLAVMASPEVGAFGVAVLAAVLLLRWAGLATVRPSLLLVAALWTASRTGMAAAAIGVPYARSEGGMATAFREGAPRQMTAWLLAAGLLAAFGLAIAWRPLAGTVSVAGEVVAGVAVIALAWRRVGGFTGDVLGAAGVVGETVGLLVACAKW